MAKWICLSVLLSVIVSLFQSNKVSKWSQLIISLMHRYVLQVASYMKAVNDIYDKAEFDGIELVNFKVKFLTVRSLFWSWFKQNNYSCIIYILTFKYLFIAFVLVFLYCFRSFHNIYLFSCCCCFSIYGLSALDHFIFIALFSFFFAYLLPLNFRKLQNIYVFSCF